MDTKIATRSELNGKVRTIPQIDKTLAIEGQCADAKATGEAIAAQDEKINTLIKDLEEHFGVTFTSTAANNSDGE